MPQKGAKYWKGKCDRLWSRLIRERDGCCIVCGNPRLQAHHLISRSAVFYRHNLENGVSLCAQCHEYNNKLSAHGAPWAFDDWMRRNRPDQYAWWEKSRHSIIEGQKIDYKAIYKELEAADG